MKSFFLTEEQLNFSFYNESLGFSLDNLFHTNLEHLEIDQIQPRIDQLERKGYQFLQSWSMGFYSPNRVVFPDDRIMDLSELCAYEKDSREGTRVYHESREALEYFGLVDSGPYTEVKWHEYPSFLNDEDEKIAKAKYNSKLAA